ncbi:MAG: chromate efflux transporter [Gaiellales bacterium]
MRQWTRIGCIGFGGPPTHITLLRRLCVDERGWISSREFEDAIAACNLLPGPASTQLSIYCAGRVAGWPGALVGGVCFIVPGLIVILALAALFLSASPPDWVRALGAGGGSAVAAVAVRAGVDLLLPSWRDARADAGATRWVLYVAAGAAATVLLGPWLVAVLLACGLAELTLRRAGDGSSLVSILLVTAQAGGWGALAWTALKVGALSFGGGFVIIPLMQADAVSHHHWMTSGQFLDAVALGQITPGPVVQTVAVVGYAAAGVGGGLLAAAVAFSPSFVFVLAGRSHFDRIRRDPNARAFLRGAGPAAVGAILGAAVPLAGALSESWQYAVLALSATAVLALRRGVVPVLAGAALAGLIALWLGAPIPA